MIAFLKNLGPGRQRTAKGKPGRKPAAGGVWAQFTLAADRLAFSWPVRQGLYRHLSAQVGNNVPVETALESYRGRLQRRGKVSSDKIVADVARRMRDGKTLAKALGTWIPADEAGVIASGELSGNLSNGLELIIESKRRLNSVKKAMKSAFVTPAVYLAAIYGLVLAIGHMTPEFEKALPASKATGMVSGLYAAGAFATSWWTLLPPVVVVAAVFGVIRSLPRWTGPNRIKAERYFPYSFYRDLNGYTWLMAFAALLKSGQPDVEILKRQKENATPWLYERLNLIWWRMDNGSSMGKALLEKGKNGMPELGFPNPDIADDIASTSGFADFPDRIVKIAQQWADDLESDLTSKAKMFGLYAEIVMYLLMGLLVMAINAMSTQMGNIPNM